MWKGKNRNPESQIRETRATWSPAQEHSICYFIITWYMGLGVAVTELDFTSTSLLVSSSEEEDPE